MKKNIRKNLFLVQVALLVAVMAMCILSTLHTFIYLDMNSQWRAIDKNGEVVSGLASYRALKEASKDIEGIVDGKYLLDLKKQYHTYRKREQQP